MKSSNKKIRVENDKTAGGADGVDVGHYWKRSIKKAE